MLSSIGEDPVPNVNELKATAKEVVDESCQPPEVSNSLIVSVQTGF